MRYSRVFTVAIAKDAIPFTPNLIFNTRQHKNDILSQMDLVTDK